MSTLAAPTALPRNDTEAYRMLFAAAASGTVDEVRVAHEQGARLDVADSSGRTVLMLTVTNGDGPAVAQYLIDQGCDVNACIPSGETALHEFAAAGRADLARIALVAGASVNGVRPAMADDAPDTPLMLAAIGDHLEVLQVLLDAGASPQLAHRSGHFPLDFAGSGAAIKMLCEHGAKPNAPRAHMPPPLFQVAASVDHHNNAELCEALIRHGADVNLRNFDGQTALHQSRGKASEVLLKHGATLDPVDVFDLTPLALAAIYNDADKCRLLVKHGASLAPPAVIQPLRAAAEDYATDSFLVLLEAGADPIGIDERLVDAMAKDKPGLCTKFVEAVDLAQRAKDLAAAAAAKGQIAATGGKKPKPA